MSICQTSTSKAASASGEKNYEGNNNDSGRKSPKRKFESYNHDFPTTTSKNYQLFELNDLISDFLEGHQEPQNHQKRISTNEQFSN